MNILAEIDTTEVAETISDAQKKAQEAIENPGVIRTYLENLIPDLWAFALQVVAAILVYVIGAKLIKYVLKLIRRSMERAGADEGVKQFLGTLIKYGLYLILITVILNVFGVATTSVVAVLGSVGVAAGLALQGSLSNMAGGVLILLLKPFRVGDYIIEDSHKNEGTVSEISIFYTKLVTIDNRVIMIPNGTLANTSMTNVSQMEKRRIDLTVGIAYDADLKEAKEVLRQVVESEEARLAEEETLVFVSELADSSVVLGARIWVASEDYWTAKWRMTENIKLAFDEHHISIPFPQLDVQIRQ